MSYSMAGHANSSQISTTYTWVDLILPHSFRPMHGHLQPLYSLNKLSSLTEIPRELIEFSSSWFQLTYIRKLPLTSNRQLGIVNRSA